MRLDIGEILFLLELAKDKISGYMDDLYRSEHLSNDAQDSTWHIWRRERIDEYNRIKQKIEVL